MQVGGGPRLGEGDSLYLVTGWSEGLGKRCGGREGGAAALAKALTAPASLCGSVLEVARGEGRTICGQKNCSREMLMLGRRWGAGDVVK